MIRLVIHPEDIKAFRLPPQKIKDKDPRGKSFRRKCGNKAATVELDALPVEELPRHVREGIERLIDFELWNRQTAVQEVELKCIVEFADTVKNLPRYREHNSL
jgi:hypothetical protein